MVEEESPWHHIVFPSFPANSMPVVGQEEGVSWGAGEAVLQQFVEEVGEWISYAVAPEVTLAAEGVYTL